MNRPIALAAEDAVVAGPARANHGEELPVRTLSCGGYRMNDFLTLLKATGRIYLRSFSDALTGFGKNWRMLFAHLAMLLSCLLVAFVAGLFGPLVGGFMLGLFLAFLLSCYLCTVASAVQNERLYFREVVSQGSALWMPAIGALFVLFLIEFISSRLLFRPDQAWMVAVVNLLVAVLFNVLPELLYQRTNTSFQLLADSFEFIRENFVEWAVPHALLGGLVFLASPALAVQLGFLFTLSNPLRMIEMLILTFAAPQFWYAAFPILCVGVAFLYFFFIFRGVLFRELSTSTRRKRIYQERFS